MGKVKNNFYSHQETQPIDSFPSSPSHSGEYKGKCGHESACMQDTEPVWGDAWIETQVMDSECDSDENLLCGETQAVDLEFETREEPLLEGKQLLEPSDGLFTQFLDHSDDELVADSGDDVTYVLEDNSDLSESDVACSKAVTLLSSEENRQHADEHGISGKVARFASVRSAAFRASALAACQGDTNSSNLEYRVGEVGNQQCPPGIPVEKKNDLRAGNRTARKLFLEDSPEENYPSAGLSYIDSQEPGEESQASALKLVDKLISESCLEFALEVGTDSGRRTKEKEILVPSVKGPQELAKKLSYRVEAGGKGTFDWDDNREDEGGGDIYRRRKEEFFGLSSKARESSTLPREHKSHKGLGVTVDKRVAHSDSKLLQHSVTRSRKKIQHVQKNLGKELDEVLRNDTQVAAEAIDALCCGDRVKFDAEAICLIGKELAPGEDIGFSNHGVITRQSKGTRRIQAMGKHELLKRRMKKACPVSAKTCGETIERSSKGNQLDKEDPWCSKRRKVQTALRETKKNHVDEVDEVSKESNTRTFDRHEEVEVGADTQMAAEAISALLSGNGREIDPEPNCLLDKKLPQQQGISSCGVVTRKSKRFKGIQAVDNDVESLKPKPKKARSILAKACENNMDRYSKNDKLATPEEVVVLSTEERRGEVSNKSCAPKLLKQSIRGETEALGHPKRRRSARTSQDKINGSGKSSDPAFDTPVKSKTASKNVSPICMGDEYCSLSSFNSNTTREFHSLTSPSVEPIIPEIKITRKRRDLGTIRVLFSQHLDEDVTKHQKKILARFNILEASSMMEATHFVADNFTRTRNMLEAIASGKPVVTTQWLESIDQVNIFVDEDRYILRDSKKEKEFGFNMRVSLARACQYPLLQGRRVFITPNTKPGLNTITTLVKAVQGLPVERLGRSALSKDNVSENLLVLSCDEDRNICIPFLERGAEVYSSELLLNGIVTQKLEYERYRLFADSVRRTRSTSKGSSNAEAGKGGNVINLLHESFEFTFQFHLE